MKISKIKTLCAAVGIACGALAAPSAQAITFTGTPYIGYIDVDIFGYDSGTTGYLPAGYIMPGDPGFALSQSGTSCTTVAGCNASASAPAPNAVGSDEDTWGVLRVNEIRNLGGDILWQAGGTEHLYGMFYGFADQTVEWSTTNGGGSFTFSAWSVGGKVKIWEHAAAISDFGSVVTPDVGPANRTALDGYLGNGVTQLNNGNLWLELNAVGGQSVANTEAAGFTTLQSSFGSTDFSGASDFFANAVGGAAASLFYADLPDENGVDRDFFVNNTNKLQGRGSWTVRADTASASNIALPEPGSMALVGLGLMGLAAMRRRKQQA